MNIFVLDRDPIKAASYLCDSHVIKMILESCQLLSAADITIYNKPQEDRYSPGWKNHPCCKCLSNIQCYRWLCKHVMQLCAEYERRYGREHSCKYLVLNYWNCTDVIDSSKLDFPLCVGDYWEDVTGIDEIVRVYRNYYRMKRDTLSRFNYRLNNMPDWLKE